MKKFLLIMMAFMASFSVYAQEESSASVTYTANLDYYVYYEYAVDINNITLPLVVQVPVPPTGTVIGVNGPTSGESSTNMA